MSRLKEHDFEDSSCAECRQRTPVGPCAACDAMICGDCGVLTTDPAGTKCICLSCARLVATVGKKRVQRHTPWRMLVAVVVILAFSGLGAAVLFR